MSYWVNESVFYHIYPLGFCGAPRINDGVEQNRIEKVLEWIPHLKSMSVNAIYFGPVFQSTVHGYDTDDYRKIDNRLGSNGAFSHVCTTLHENGIKVILDGVFNHVGRNFWAFKDVREKGQASPYCSWFQNLHFGGSSPYGDPFSYEGWQGHFDLVKLNLKNPDVVNYLLESVRIWMDEFKIDGLRLDAADCVDPDFFRALRRFTKDKDPNFWLMGEIIHGDYNHWANPEMLDSVTNYECYKGIYSSHNDKNYFEIAHSLNRQFGNGGIYRNIYTYNFADNHDVNRVASTVNKREHLKNIYTVVYCMPGVPSIYYGGEWGLEGQKSPTEYDYPLRPSVELSDIQDNDLLEHIKLLGKARCSLDALKYGSFENTMIKNEQLVFKRKSENQTVYVALNLSESPSNVGFNAEGAYLEDKLSGKVYKVENGYINLEIPAHSSMILLSSNTPIQPSEQKEDNADTANPQPTVQEQPAPAPLPQRGTKGRHRHFKGGEYDVLYIAKHSETGEELVIYKDTHSDNVWARPANMFYEYVNINGKQVPRFEFIG